jgi:site-specific DNA-methyltransferase (adenine-specific)
LEDLKVEYVDIDSIKPYKKNAKLHPKEQIEQIKKSIEEFGMNDPIAIDKDNIIIEGHGRLLACKDLGITEVPIIRLDHLTDEQRKAYTLAHNKLTMNTDFDIDILTEELNDILDIDMSDFGFDLDFEDEEEQEIVEDEVPEVPEEPKAKLGDIYQLGNHRLMCGDSTSEEDIAKLMNGVKADMVFTDPPYGYEYQSNMRTKTQKFDVIENDDKKLDFMPIVKKFNNGFVFVCTTWKVLKEWLEIFTKYYNLSNMIIWNKGGGGIGDLKHTFSTDYEIILCSNNDKEITGKRIGSVWTISKDNANDYIHATQKPVEVSATAIKNTTNENDNILDLFGGSGSTLIACEQLNRKCYMMELDPHYIDVIIQRWENFTGEKAIKLN